MPDKAVPHIDLEKYDVFKISKRRSCELVVTPSPCVKKALFHLERLKVLTQVKKKDSMKQEDVSLKQGDSSLKQITSSQVDEKSSKKQLRFLSLSDGASSDDITSEITSDMELVIRGLGGSVGSDAKKETMLSKIQLTPQEVFNQVANLIVRLEEDRAETERALEREKKRVTVLTHKIDDISQKRLIQLPIAVQKEHDACACDISELQWHVSYTTRQLDRSKDKLAAARVLNNSLREDIDFVKKHCPLVEEKLISEKEAMKVIKQMQDVTDQELESARELQGDAEEKYKAAVDKADVEREHIRKELEGTRYQLGMLKKDLSHSKAMHQAYKKKAEQSREKLEKQDAELIELEKKIEVIREAEQKEFYRISDLRDTIRQVEFETGEVHKKKASLENDLVELHKTMEERIAGLEVAYKDDLKKLRQLQESNRDLKYDIEDMKEEIKTCEKSIAKAERELARYQKERERMELQLKVATDDVASISMVNLELKNQLEKEESKSQALEDALKETAENLRKQVNDEMKQRQALEVKRQQNTKALLKGKTDNVKKKKVIERTLEETMAAVTKASDEVKRLAAEHEATVETINELEAKLAELNVEHEEVENALVRRKAEVEPIEAKLQEEQMRLKAKIKEIEEEEAQMQRKLKEIKVTQGAMNKRFVNTEHSIAELESEYEELQIQLENGEATNQHLKAQLEDATERLAEREKIHEEMMKERNAVRIDLQENVDKELAVNQVVAARYRELQSEHLDLKNRLMSLYDTKVKMEVSIKDHKQLLALQGKLNHALEQYYHDRAEFNKAGLNKFKMRSKDSDEMMVDVQKGLELAIDNISLFLRSQIDGSAVNRVHQAAMHWLAT